MKNYYYVVARKHLRTEVLDFCHVLIQAKDETDAYVAGYAEMSLRHPDYVTRVKRGGDWNDYVIEVSNAELRPAT